MTNTLKHAVAEVERLPREDQEIIGRQVLTHVEKLRALRGDIDAGMRSLNAGEGKVLDMKDVCRVLDVGMKRSRRAIIWSPEAEQDLSDIWQHIADRSSVIADKILCDIEATCLALAAWPELGSSRDHVREGLRARRVDRYVIFYRIDKRGIAVVRVLHERRDVDTIFSDGE
jgi:toxin ParE1/3/4